MNFFSKVQTLARMVKIEHSVFALPFAYMGAFLADGGMPSQRVMVFLTIAMVAVRSFAMAFNRLADLPLDRENPRTQNRELVTGAVTITQTRIFLLVTAAVFIAACAGLNSTCLKLAPPALLFCAFYSYVKRFSCLCHFVLGAVLGLAPIAGWIAVQPGVTLPMAHLFLGVLFWVAGFDILYACQDVDFDRVRGLHSVPARFGVAPALAVSLFCHGNASLFFLLAGWSAWLGWPYYVAWALVSAVLIWEHKLISEDDLSRINLAFFTLNGLVSLALLAGVLLAL
jgi:4-hydroxybenzoate polyprenyltransferase